MAATSSFCAGVRVLSLSLSERTLSLSLSMILRPPREATRARELPFPEVPPPP